MHIYNLIPIIFPTIAMVSAICENVIAKKRNYITAVRENITYISSGIWLFWLPLTYIGYSVQDIGFAITTNLSYQFFSIHN